MMEWNNNEVEMEIGKGWKWNYEIKRRWKVLGVGGLQSLYDGVGWRALSSIHVPVLPSHPYPCSICLLPALPNTQQNSFESKRKNQFIPYFSKK